MNRKSVIPKPITTIRNDLNVVNNSTTTTERRDSLLQQKQCTPMINLDDSDNNDDDIVCKTETPSPINCENNIILYYCECGDESQHSPVELFDSDDDGDDCNIIDNNSFTCIRYDYDNKTKDDKVNDKLDGTTTTTTTNYRHTTPLFKYMKESKQQQQQEQNDSLKNKTIINNNHHHHHHYQLKRFDYHKSNGTKIDGNHDDINNKIIDNEAKSPETRKNELCTYLKLMKPSEQQKQQQQDEEENLLLRNRRSIRVKNLNLQNEKKQIDQHNDNDDDHNDNNNNNNRYLPLPPAHIYKKETYFDDDILAIIVDRNLENVDITQKDVDIIGKKRLLRARVNRNKLNWRRVNSLRSKGRLKNVSLDQLILRRNRLRRQRQQQQQKKKKQQQMKKRTRLETIEDKHEVVVEESSSSSPSSTNSERCEIITICTIDSDDDDDDVSNNNNNPNNNNSNNSDRTIENVTNLTNLNNEERKELLNNLIGVPTTMDQKDEATVQEQIDLKSLINSEHDYAEYDDDDVSLDSSESSSDSQNAINVNVEKEVCSNSNNNNNNNTAIVGKRSNKNPPQQEEQSNHSIKISNNNGSILCCKYMNNHLIIVQQDLISLWTQSQLGSILCSQNMWIPNGQIKRLILNNNNDYIQKLSNNCVVSNDTNFSYIELWIKEHKSDYRKYPVCDIFASVYYWRHRQIGLNKKLLQLENIKGASEHVQYVVLTNLPLIIVCWYIIDGSNNNECKTYIRSYMLAGDYQTVAQISEFATINHYISSLHNIEDCDNLVMGCGDNRILLWNTEHGYLIANIDLYDLKPALSTLWAKCDRGFIFVVQQHQDEQMRLIAINGLNNSWKQLHTYGPSSSSLNKLLNIYIENGILIAYYKDGVLCWNTQTGKPVLEDIPNNVVYIPSGKYVIIVVNDERILIKHALTHFLITAQDL